MSTQANRKLKFQSEVQSLSQTLAKLDVESALALVAKQFGDRAILSSSLAIESQVLTHMWCKINPKARVFVLDTCRMHEETYKVMAESMKFFGIKYEVTYPDAEKTAAMVRERGPNLFYESVENRKLCCQLRKVEPMRKLLQTADLWITGLRKDQSLTSRSSLELVEWDDGNGLIKLNPIKDWTLDEIWKYARAHKLPYNELHDKGYPSIGCAPCTRAVKPGEDERAGRWWWETPENKECGIHLVDGKFVRTGKG